ncbi:MAG: adenosylcobinamide-GDP ribazoletransferase [Rhodobacteraceae bacterium]|nr:adenosylcobinamide-GDP ribazoletransferase [Paracoccaceae bacterium]
MRHHDTDPTHLTLKDIVSAFGLLTRLPVPQNWPMRGAASGWAWPLVGLAVGMISAATGSVALALGIPTGVAAAISLTTTAIVTGGLHEDGLADSADGLFGNWTRERRLKIMKKSNIGSYGALALVFTVLARWSALSALMATGHHWQAMGAAGALSRAPMVALMAALPNARGSGLSASTGVPTANITLAAIGIAFVIAFLTTGTVTIALIPVTGVTALVIALTAKARIGGQTGDILGAAQQLTETAVLAALTTLLL